MTWSGIAIILVTVFWGFIIKATGGNNNNNKDEFQTVDVAKLASHAYGTELILLDNSYQEQKSYRFEDFFWTGSGDGSSDEEDLWDTENPSTLYKTKTVTSTLYMETPPTSYNLTTTENTTKCTFNCETPSTPSGEISPTPTFNSNEETTSEEDFFDADRQFWLLTVLKSDGKDPVIIDLKNSLAKLYRTAFQRQQERHLGIISRRKKRDTPTVSSIKRKTTDKPVKVYIHNVEKTKMNGNEKIQVLYHVAVSGKPVAAVTAAEDMELVSDEEVRTELGYPFFIKAEPYLKAAEPQGLSRANNTWIFIGVSLVVLLVLLLIVAFLTLGLTKCKKAPAGIDNRRQIFERGIGTDNGAFVHHETGKLNEESPTYINFKNQPSDQTVRSGIAANRQQFSFSSSSSSSASLDISPLMGLKKQRTPPKKPPRPKAALNKTAPLNVKRIAPELFDSDSNGSNSPDTIIAGNYDPRIVSPKSYLSMPSVKAFPRGNMPEPLNKVLEPVSVLHLDMPDDEIPVYDEQNFKPSLIRYGSVGAVEDPGVIGPVVWNMHCQRLQHGVSVDEGIDDLKTTNNVSKMRKRFHELLDDTFSLFGSRRDSPVDNYKDSKAIPIEIKSHSAANTRPNDEIKPIIRPRPKTTDLRKVIQSPGSSGPKGAWASTAPSPLIRPLSAGPVIRPQVNVEHVLAEGKFKANDPAVPLIAAIKSEIEKCSLPGSTTDLHNK